MQLKKKFNIIFGVFALIVGVYMLFMAPFVTPFILGGVILQGILGGFSGKVGPVVGGKWKDIDYMRGYVVPANPNTAGQQAVRLKFKNLIELGRLLLAPILQPYWDKFYSNQSGFNAWLSQNYALANSTGVIGVTAVMSKGTLEAITLLAGVYTTGTGDLTTSWDGTSFGNGLSTDKVLIIGYDTVNKDFYFSLANEARGDEAASITLRPGLTATAVIVWAFAFRGTGTELVVSDSLGDVCAAP